MPSLKPPRYAIAALNGFSQILLQAHPVCGFLILLAMGLHAPELMIGAMLGVLASTLGAAALGYPQADIDIGLYGYNGALLGLLLMLLLGLSALSLGLIALGAAVSNLLQVRLLTAMRERNWLPGFTLPFILFGWFALALVGALAPAASVWSEAPLALNGTGLLLAVGSGIGQVIFLTQPLAGLLLLAAVWLADRKGAAWMLCGSVAGVAIGLATGAPEQQVLAGLTGYNPALAALAVSQVQRSWLAPLMAIITAAVLRLIFDQLGLPPLTMPFILACWLVALGSRWYRLERA
ncbi:urea transporter [Stutzerimonas stutzeri]|uniref:urea transporter n=1 Tax=Stutzerimonas stutzeri TaxID=316 RepID=UPI00265A6A00|nr:urea transporter [Stutzerimonas stutzeri]MCF6781447.1 urea transporter [Stutzerimonas stutzeri]MCF6804117.1 urea transporter [Stutzerimonas stutzeri]